LAAPPHPIVVTLELDPSAEPIRGVARDERGAEHPFTGWLGLARALELTLDSAAGLEAPEESSWR
jgi:hypothetical protein